MYKHKFIKQDNVSSWQNKKTRIKFKDCNVAEIIILIPNYIIECLNHFIVYCTSNTCLLKKKSKNKRKCMFIVMTNNSAMLLVTVYFYFNSLSVFFMKKKFYNLSNNQKFDTQSWLQIPVMPD